MSIRTRRYATYGLPKRKQRDGIFFNVETLLVERIPCACRGGTGRLKATITVNVDRLVPLAGKRSIDLFIKSFINCGPREPEHVGGDGLVVL
jgi:hypothetical protein